VHADAKPAPSAPADAPLAPAAALSAHASLPAAATPIDDQSDSDAPPVDLTFESSSSGLPSSDSEPDDVEVVASTSSPVLVQPKLVQPKTAQQAVQQLEKVGLVAVFCCQHCGSRLRFKSLDEHAKRKGKKCQAAKKAKEVKPKVLAMLQAQPSLGDMLNAGVFSCIVLVLCSSVSSLVSIVVAAPAEGADDVTVVNAVLAARRQGLRIGITRK